MENEGENQKQDAADLLHNKQKLQSLRTYQGDVAEAIKRQNESVASIAIKEKVREEKSPEPQKIKREVPLGLFKILLGLFLVAGSVFALFLVGNRLWQGGETTNVQIKTDIIPTNNRATLANITKENLKAELARVSTSGVTLVSLSDSGGKQMEKADDLFALLKAEPPNIFARNLSEEFALGVYASPNLGASSFVILKSKDFGAAFAGMLDWEPRMKEDLAFLIAMGDGAGEKSFAWKDMIIKNKDVRALANLADEDDVLLAYTFMDKNTILVSGSASVLGHLANIYASRAVAR